MLISTKGRYALRMMIALGRIQEETQTPVSLKDIAKIEDISMKYLEQLARSLAAANIIESYRGRYGGYKLVKPAEETAVGDILRVAEGSTAPVSCLENGALCPREKTCSTVAFWKGLDDAIEGYINGVFLADLLK